MKILLDTCVILDYLQERSDGLKEANIIFDYISDNKIKGCITVKSLMDIYYSIKHYWHEEDTVRTALKYLFKLFEVLDSKHIEAYSALDSQINDYEDALMVETALNNDVDYIVTRDKDYKGCKIAVTPKQFLKII